jgi:hypothetical protein
VRFPSGRQGRTGFAAPPAGRGAGLAAPRRASPRQGLWAAYVALWLVIGLFLAIAELQHYLQRGGRHPWEPFLWELSSSLSHGVLALGVFQWHRRLFESDRPVALRPRLALAPAVEGPLLIVATFAVCLASFEAVRRVRWLRPLFGLRLRDRPVGWAKRSVPTRSSC